MDWVKVAKDLFRECKPAHFTNYRHCDECAEHDNTLKVSTVDTIGIEELGNPGWDPICFCSDEGKRYYMPALIRLSLETVQNEFYFGQFLFHLENVGKNNCLILSCSEQQRKFIASFVEHMINTYADEIERNLYTDEALKVHGAWAKV